MKKRGEKIFLIISILIAIVIFYFSSLPGERAEKLGPSFPLKPIIYHFGIFFLLSFFLSIYSAKKWNKNYVFFSVVICFIYGVLDEVHQIFVPGRTFSLFDIFIDAAGIFLGSIIVFMLLLMKEK